jgi:hypothetical protein
MKKQRDLLYDFYNFCMDNYDGDLHEYAIDEFLNTTKVESEYILGENSINGITLNEKIRDEELHEYYIIDRKDFISELIRWIGEARESDKYLMQEDLEMLLEVEDEYILSSNRTNSYLYVGCDEFNETCEELLALNLEL